MAMKSITTLNGHNKMIKLLINHLCTNSNQSRL